VKPVVAKAEEVTEEPPKTVEIKDKKLGAETIKGDPDAVLSVEPVGTGTAAVVEEVDNKFTTLQVSKLNLIFQEELKFYKFVGNNYQTQKKRLKGKVYVTFVVEKDGSLTDIKVIRDMVTVLEKKLSVF
jgi:protein TonB